MTITNKPLAETLDKNTLSDLRSLFDNPNSVLIWENDKNQFALNIWQDNEPINPRIDDTFCHMYCFHPRYSLGDEYAGIEDFWRSLIEIGVPVDVLADYAESHDLESIGDVLDLVYENARRIVPHNVKDYIYTIPVWLYDHSGITVSCGKRTGQFADRWDSRQVGWIAVPKKKVLDMGYDENKWREEAERLCQNEIRIYDTYLRGEVYGFTVLLHHKLIDEPENEWEDIDSCGSFYGEDIESIVDSIDENGLKAALIAKSYKLGSLQPHITTWYSIEP